MSYRLICILLLGAWGSSTFADFSLSQRPTNEQYEELMWAISATGLRRVHFEYPNSKDSMCELSVVSSDRKIHCYIIDVGLPQCMEARQIALETHHCEGNIELTRTQFARNFLGLPEAKKARLHCYPPQNP
jgi:hypothetical protein